MKMFQSKSKKFGSIMAVFFAVLFGMMANGCGGGGGGGDTTVAAPGAPENFLVSGAKGQGMLTLTLTWDKPSTGGAVASYEIYRSDANVGVFDPVNHYVSLPATIDPLQFIENAGMEDNTSYWVVAAKNAGGETPSTVEAYLQGSAGGGEIEGYGNNFSGALIFADGYGITGEKLSGAPWTKVVADIDTATGLRPSAAQILTLQALQVDNLPYLDENTTFILGDTTYYKQQTVSTWQGEWVDGSGTPQVATAKWSDNMVSQTQLTTNSVFRIEMGLTKVPDTNMTAYNMEYLYGSGMTEMQGTDGVEYNATTAFVYASTARLKIEKVDVDGVTLLPLPTPVDQPLLDTTVPDGPGKFGAEVTVSGNLTYGFVWNIRDNNLGAGTYRITFLLNGFADNVTTVQNNTEIGAAENGVQDSSTQCHIDITIN